MRRALLLLSVLVLAGLAPVALAQGLVPPASAPTVDAGGVTVAHWMGTRGAVDAEMNTSERADLWFAMKRADDATGGNASGPQRAFVNLSSPDLSFSQASLVLAISNVSSQEWAFASASVLPLLNASGNATYTFTVQVYREDANGTATLLGQASGSGAFAVVVPGPVAPPPGGVPTAYLVGGGAAVVVGGAAALYAMRQRREKRLMNQAPRRSQVMREMELERELEKVEEKEPERAQEIKEEIRAQEVVREKRRELQILEAKRADALKTMDLLRKRHETGGLTKLQYDNMVAKKQADLQRIEAEIAQMEAEDAAGGSAAA